MIQTIKTLFKVYIPSNIMTFNSYMQTIVQQKRRTFTFSFLYDKLKHFDFAH